MARTIIVRSAVLFLITLAAWTVGGQIAPAESSPKTQGHYAVVSRILTRHDTPHGILVGWDRPNKDGSGGGASWTQQPNGGRGGCRW
jgi:hypothetical protein